MGSRLGKALAIVLMAFVFLNAQCMSACAFESCLPAATHDDAPPCHEKDSDSKRDCQHPVVSPDQAKASLVDLVAAHAPGAFVEATHDTFASPATPLTLCDSRTAAAVSSCFTVLRI